MEEEKKTISLKIGWVGYMRSIIMLIECDNEEANSYARKQLLKLADHLENENKDVKGIDK
tara:strand:- start:2431 stop:2610 length:180 start_codon:yes stop_codon:yes gene_type:complete